MQWQVIDSCSRSFIYPAFFCQLILLIFSIISWALHNSLLSLQVAFLYYVSMLYILKFWIFVILLHSLTHSVVLFFLFWQASEPSCAKYFVNCRLSEQLQSLFSVISCLLFLVPTKYFTFIDILDDFRYLQDTGSLLRY